MIITTVHRPTLTEQERARRMEEIRQATVELMTAVYQQQEAHRRNTKK